MRQTGTQPYKTTGSKYKGGAEEMYVTYDLWQETRGKGRALYPKVKRVYIAGQVKDWHVGTFAKRTGKHVHGVKIEYTQSRTASVRKGYTATRGSTQYHVAPTQARGVWHGFPKLSKYRKRRTTCSSIRANPPRATVAPSRTCASAGDVCTARLALSISLQCLPPRQFRVVFSRLGQSAVHKRSRR
jgi:hypothetical protein